MADAQTRGEVADTLDPTTVATLFLAIPLGIVLLDAAGVEVPGADTWAEVARQTAAALRPQDAKEATGHGVRAKRSKSGAISFDLLAQEESRAAL